MRELKPNRSTGYHTCKSIQCRRTASKGRKNWELKHLSTNEEKSTERPKVVASEIGKTCDDKHRIESSEEEKQVKWRRKGNFLIAKANKEVNTTRTRSLP